MGSTGDDGRRRARKPLWAVTAALVALVAFALGLGLGRGTSTGEQPSAKEPGPSRVEGGVPLGYARSEAGAVTAAATYLQVLSRPVNLEPSRARDVYARFVLPGAVEDVVAARSLPEEFRGVTTEPSFAFVVDPLGYRIDAFEHDEAVIEIWGISIVTGPGDLAALPRQQLQDAWAVARMTLRWVDGDWKVAALEDRTGPQPPDIASGMRSFERFLHRPWLDEDEA